LHKEEISNEKIMVWNYQCNTGCGNVYQYASVECTRADNNSTITMSEMPANVVEEDESKRSEFYKEFILSNGLRLATIYPNAVHYENNGQ
jgi:hypothetical protein